MSVEAPVPVEAPVSVESPIIGWDLGGAHLKAARVDAQGRVVDALQLPCPLWEGLDRLDQAMGLALERLGPAPTHALTMTGEMADLFPSRPAGVGAILALAAERLRPGRVLVFAGSVGLVSREEAERRPLDVASANWLASAMLAARKLPHGLLIDIGSTTTDIIPFEDGRILALGGSDHERLANDELVYTGIVRTPVMAVTDSVVFEGTRQAIVAELFATMADAHRVNGTLPEDADQMPAADRGGKSVADSARRLARMLGRDFESHDLAAWRRLAATLVDCQKARIEQSCRRVLARGSLPWDAPFVAAGCGKFFVPELAARLHRNHVEFTSLIAVEPAARYWAGIAAPAVSVACLALTS